jgi:hypothetical protein
MSDDSTMHTADDALASKLSAIELKYVDDKYSKYFYSQRKVRKPPIINRGYYARVECFKQAVHHFLESTAACPQRQIVILGSGFDTLALKLLLPQKSLGSGGAEAAPGPSTANLLVAEVDFPPMVRRKLAVLMGNSELAAQIQAATGVDGGASSSAPTRGRLNIPPSISEVEAEMEAACVSRDAVLMPPPAPPLRVGGGPTPLQKLDEAVRASQVAFAAAGGKPAPAHCVLHNRETNSALYLVPHDLRAAAPATGEEGEEQGGNSDEEDEWRGDGMALGDKLKQLIARHCPSVVENATVDTPTLILTECVLVYMNRASTARLISSLTTPACDVAAATSASAVPGCSTFSNYIWCSYDMVNPQDAFGKMMVRNLTTLGPFSLPGLLELPLLVDRAESFTGGRAVTSNCRSNTATAYVRGGGGDNAEGAEEGEGKVAASLTMLTAYNKIVSPEEKQRIAR